MENPRTISAMTTVGADACGYNRGNCISIRRDGGGSLRAILGVFLQRSIPFVDLPSRYQILFF